MNKTQLLVQISQLLEESIVAYEVTDLKLEQTDHGTLRNINVYLQQAVESLRKARRSGRTLLEEYEDDLSKKSNIHDRTEGVDEDEDEDDDEDEDEDEDED
jgi:hypothetical protein